MHEAGMQSAIEDGQNFSALEFKIGYHRVMTRETGQVSAEGWIVSGG
jgi:hypothetical protein